MPGDFYRGPLVHGGFLWAFGGDGLIHRLAPRGNAMPRAMAAIASSTAPFSRHAIVDVQVAGSGIAGPVLVAADAAGVYAASLLDGEVHTLFAAGEGSEVSANATVEESPYFRGVAVTGDLFSFVVRPRGGGDWQLVVASFNRERANEVPIRFAPGPYVGPVTSRGLIGLCTQAEVWIYDAVGQTVRSGPLPASFVPYVQRPPNGTNVPPGHVPFVIGDGRQGWQAWIAGEDGGRCGVLEVHVDSNHYRFHPTEAGGSACVVEGGGLCVTRAAGLDLFGASAPQARVTGLEAGMPIHIAPSWLACFRRRSSPGVHRLSFFRRAGAPLVLSFQDLACNENTCCGVHLLGGAQLLVSYLALPRAANQPRGLGFAHWSLQ